jgi:hypothetical protein
MTGNTETILRLQNTFRIADQPSSIGAGKRELGAVELGQDRGWLVADLRMNDMSGAVLANKEAHCVESLAG